MRLLAMTLLLTVTISPAAFANETRTYDLPAFTEIKAGGDLELEVQVGAGKQEVSLTADPKVLADLDVKVVGNRLEIGRTKSEGWRWPWEDKTVKGVIKVEKLSDVDLSGAVELNLKGATGDKLEVELSGAAEATLQGKVRRLELELSGAGKVAAFDLIAEEASVEVSGAGKVECHATKVLDAEVSGAGSVIYAGNPAKVREEVSGVGKVAPRG